MVSKREQWLNVEYALSCWRGLSVAGFRRGKRGRKNVSSPFILPGKVSRAEWHKSFSLDEIYKSNFNGQIIPAPDNKFENINHHVI